MSMPDLAHALAPARAPTPESDVALQRALADAVTAFGSRVREHGQIAAFSESVTPAPTDVAVTVAAMLKAAEVTSFEIAALFNV